MEELAVKDLAIATNDASQSAVKVDARLDEDHKEQDKSGVKILLDKALSSKIRLPMLEIIYDRFVRMTSNSLRNFTSYNVDVEISKMDSIRFGEFIDSIPVPSMIAVVKAIEWDNFGLVIIDNPLSYSIVDILFGGRRLAPSLKVEGRPYTSIEQSMVQSIVELLLNDLSSSFEPVAPVTFQLERMETNPRFAAIARPEDVALLLSLTVEMESRSGSIEILLPFSTIEPVKKLLAKSFIGERGSKDPTWSNHLEDEISQTNVIVDAAINGKIATIKDMMNLNVGDTIVLDKFVNDDICLRIDGIEISSGKLGKLDDKVAVQLTDDINLERFKK